MSGMGERVTGFVAGLGDRVVELSRDKWWKLALSIMIDIIGILTFLIPILGEFGDIFWAPMSSLLLFQMYGSPLLSGLALLEEGLPFTDLIPTATIGWLCEFTIVGSWLGLNLAQSAPSRPLRPNPRVTHID
uniref:Uncharacterized protein n=1 Tax=Hemiselmis tepida TaxID=464990 RepID=A0A7S0VU74_9CRYP|mmetsp:Transcript_2675/g.6819  ORF Transcript_2675/g.6819 Transcript_2675/m.6819 type:complete len:132 (+) Transcript_2675:56-451(+)